MSIEIFEKFEHTDNRLSEERDLLKTWILCNREV